MKKMLFLIVIGILMTFSSCSTYYYSVLSSTDRGYQRNVDGDFIQENDTVSISYSFSGEDAPVHIAVYNKLDKPLYVDWKRSAIIIDGNATNYYDGMSMEFQGEIYSSDFTGEIRGYSSGTDMIPPKSMVQHQPLCLDNLPFDKIPDREYKKTRYAPDENTAYDLRIREYTEDDSPLYFRSFITLYTEDEAGRRNNMYLERSFFASQVIKAGSLAPNSFRPTRQGVGDTFYVRKVKGRTFGYAVASIAVIAGIVALEVALGPYDEYYY